MSLSLPACLAQGPSAPTEADPRHVPEEHGAPGREGAVQQNQNHRGEVRGPRGGRRGPAEEASGTEGKYNQLGK